MSTVWTKSVAVEGIYEGRDRASGELKWTATPVDLVFGSHAELRAIAEVYAESGGEARFVSDFVGMEVIPKAGTLLGYDDEAPVTTPYDECVLIMPSRRMVPGQTAVRLGQFTDA